MTHYHNRIVVKVGTSTLTNEMGLSDFKAFDKLACVLSDIQNKGYEVILVSSGAIAVGMHKLGMKTKPESMRLKQAAAAVGQCRIMFLYDKFFGDSQDDWPNFVKRGGHRERGQERKPHQHV